jgi:hypothetical protein
LLDPAVRVTLVATSVQVVAEPACTGALRGVAVATSAQSVSSPIWVGIHVPRSVPPNARVRAAASGVPASLPASPSAA